MKKTVKENILSSRKYVNILGIKVISTQLAEVIAGVENFISHNSKFYIVTPNSELILASTKNKELKDALSGADLPVPDSVGLNYASKFLYGKSLNIIPGRKLFVNLVEISAENGWKVFFLGGEGGEAETAAQELRAKYPKVKIQTFAGPMLNQKAEPLDEENRELEKEAIKRINEFSPELLFVAFKNPKQEIWIRKNLSKLKINGTMTVGGTFRYIAGMSKLPPEWISKVGFEWLWRLVTEPYRFKRIINAVILFPLRVFWFKVSGN